MPQKHILMIETGGTFGTDLNEKGLRSLGNGSVFEYPVIKEKIAAENFTFDVQRPFRLLSENMTVSRLESLLGVLQGIDFSAYDGVIVTHGTDTLAYSVNLAAFALGSIAIPLVFVSANRPLADPLSNGLDNFIGALDMILSGEKGVFAVYRNGDGRIYVHRGGRLHQMDSLHPGFYSQNEVFFGELIDHHFAYHEHSQNQRCPMGVSAFSGKNLNSGIVQIHPYPGFDYRRIDMNGVDAVIHFTYHTGMYCADGYGENLDTLLISLPQSVPVMMVGGTGGEERYESALRNGDRLCFLDDTAGEAVYAKALLAFGNMEREEALDYMQKNILGERLLI